MPLEWNADRIVIDLTAKSWEGVVRAALVLETRAKELLSVGNPAPHKTPAPKGEPPRLRTGFGRANVAFDLDRANLTARVGVRPPAFYLAWHELHGRPWLLRALREALPAMKKAAGG